MSDSRVSDAPLSDSPVADANRANAAVSTRRSVLKGLTGLAAGSLAGSALAAPLAPVARAAAPLVLGVLLPGHGAAATSLHFRQGLTLALSAGQNSASVSQVRVLDAQLGHRPSEIPDAALALTAQGAGALVALGDGMAGLLAPLAEARRVPLIAAEVGVHMPRGEARQQYVYRASLNHWQAQWAHGAALARTAGHVHLLMSSLEAGYDLPYAFSAGFQAAGGRTLSSSFLDTAAAGLDLQGALGRIRDERPDAVHLLASGEGADAFARAYSSLALRPALSSGSLTPVAGTAHAASWHAGLRHPASAAFEQAYRREYRAAPDALAALGHETGQWLLQALGTAHGASGAGWTAGLSATGFSGARGAVTVDASAHSTSAGLLLSTPGALGTPPQALTPPPARHPALGALLHAPRSGWLSPYLHG